ncbi:GAF domain-containing protein [soil metagenome]
MVSKNFVSAMGRLESASPGDLHGPFLSVFPVTGVAVSTLGDFLGSETVSASDGQAARLDELQFDLGEGPCWDAMKGGGAILEPDIKRHPRRMWPAFSEAIANDQVSALFAFPLAIGPLHIGAVDMYSAVPMELGADQEREAHAMAGLVGRRVLRQALTRIGSETGNEDEVDRGNVFSRRVIHQATGMVLAQLNISAEDAQLVIRGHAFATSRSMMDIARDIVDRRMDFSNDETGIEVSQ